MNLAEPARELVVPLARSRGGDPRLDVLTSSSKQPPQEPHRARQLRDHSAQCVSYSLLPSLRLRAEALTRLPLSDHQRPVGPALAPVDVSLHPHHQEPVALRHRPGQDVARDEARGDLPRGDQGARRQRRGRPEGGRAQCHACVPLSLSSRRHSLTLCPRYRLWRCTSASRALVEDPTDLLKWPRLQIMSKFYLSHRTFLALKDLPLKSNMRTLLETLAASTEFSSYRFRQGEKSVRPPSLPLPLAAASAESSFPCRSSRSTTRCVVPPSPATHGLTLVALAEPQVPDRQSLVDRRPRASYLSLSLAASGRSTDPECRVRRS